MSEEIKIHELKCLPCYFEYTWGNDKKFEIRLNDRDFKVGDKIKLKEYYLGAYSGRFINAEITFITDFEQKEGLKFEEKETHVKIEDIMHYMRCSLLKTHEERLIELFKELQYKCSDLSTSKYLFEHNDSYKNSGIKILIKVLEKDIEEINEKIIYYQKEIEDSNK